ncbi:MAG: hypothetical protein ISS63_07665 [Desulfobacteraceae bacterium]|nr:hypothetical protein [Desulfobacteraceae bacterium]
MKEENKRESPVPYLACIAVHHMGLEPRSHGGVSRMQKNRTLGVVRRSLIMGRKR